MAKRRGTKKAAAPATPTMDDLNALAEEMNAIMGLDPEIDAAADELDEAGLIEVIKEEAYDEDGACQIFTTDEFSEQSWATFKDLGIDAVEPPDGEPAEEEAEEEEAPEEEEEAPEPPKKKAAGKKKAAPKKAAEPKAAPAEKKKAAPKKAAAKRYTRIDAAVEVLSSNVKDLDKLAEKANDLYAASGGKDNLNEAKWSINLAAAILTGLKLAEVKDNKITIG